MEQYHHKQQLAMKHATTEQLRRRQARIQHQYNLLGQLAKKNNTALIDKSIEILSNVSDVDLARTEWATSILAGLEKAEEARVQQIHFEQKIGLINAFHAYDAERQRIEEEYQVSCLKLVLNISGMLIQITATSLGNTRGIYAKEYRRN